MTLHYSLILPAISKTQKQIKLPIVKINGMQIERVDNLNFLGVIINKNLT